MSGGGRSRPAIGWLGAGQMLAAPRRCRCYPSGVQQSEQHQPNEMGAEGGFPPASASRMQVKIEPTAEG